MKKLLKKITLYPMVFIFLLLYSNYLFGQYLDYSQSSKSDVGYSDVDKYRKAIIPQDYFNRFKKDEDQKNFRKLREFLKEKEDLKTVLENLIRTKSLTAARNDFNKDLFKSRIEKIKRKLGNHKENENISVPYELSYEYGESGDLYSLDWDDSIRKNKVVSYSDLKAIQSSYENAITDLSAKDSIIINLNQNLDNVKQDIYNCRSQIDSILAPEYKQQDFRTNISICFTVLIGVLLVSFFVIVYKKSDNSLSKELLSSNGLQFITLFVLIIAVILFGILSILQGSELAAILSGISGYILGKGGITFNDNKSKPNADIELLTRLKNEGTIDDAQFEIQKLKINH